MKAAEDVSLRPYLLRAIYEWCAEKKYTPYLAVQGCREDVRLPPSLNTGDKVVVLNIDAAAVRDLTIGKTFSFTARFQGATFHVTLPVGAVVGIYARETGVGLSFPPVAEVPTGAPGGVLSGQKPALRVV